MPLLLLTDENLAAAKSDLRAKLPAIRSSHLTEALAAGLNFHTHAALLSAIDTDCGRPPALAFAESRAFSKRLDALGYPNIDFGHLDYALSETVVPDAPYTAFKKGDRAANDNHYYACQRRNRPMLMIKTARRYAELEWDCITISPDQEDYLYGTDNGRTLLRTMFTTFQSLAKGEPGKPYFTGSSFTGSVERLLPETARKLAEEYFKLLYLPLRDPDQRGAKHGRVGCTK